MSKLKTKPVLEIVTDKRKTYTVLFDLPITKKSAMSWLWRQ